MSIQKLGAPSEVTSDLRAVKKGPTLDNQIIKAANRRRNSMKI